MVLLNVKQGNNSLFLYETSVNTKISNVLDDILQIRNGIEKVTSIATELETRLDKELNADIESTDNECKQMEDLQLNDTTVSSEKSSTSAADVKQADFIRRAISESRNMISTKQLEAGITLRCSTIHEALQVLEGSVNIFTDSKDPETSFSFKSLEENYEKSSKPLNAENTVLWFSSKQLDGQKPLSDYIGKNEKSKVILKVQPKHQGPPPRELGITEEQQKELMLQAFRRQQELKVFF